jgi:flagella basal body P-ring formation protein FlgA
MQVVIAVVLLAWATQTLLHQWGYGAEVSAQSPAEKFVPASSRLAAPVTIELRGEATVVGAEVRLKQVCRWSDRDAQFFAPVADLTISRVTSRAPFRAVTIDKIKQTLHDAGVNLAMIRFAGPISCTVSRSDSEYDEGTALRQWAEARGEVKDDAATRTRGDTEKAKPMVTAAPRVTEAAAPPTQPSGVRSLRSLLLDDLSIRLGLPQEQLQVSFNPKDESLLNLSEPLFKFNLSARRVRNLGDVSWDVTILNGSSSQKGTVTATARAWQTQALVAKPLAYHQLIQQADLVERRALVERLPDEQLLTVEQVVGQEAARDLKVGTILSARMIDPVPLVKPGQTVTITLTQGAVSVKTVGRALESGSFGQAVKVKNDATRDVYEVIMTGPQQGSLGPLPVGARVAGAR